jgi:hypothetical protein
VGITQPDRRTTETGASQESCERRLQLGEFKMKVSLHESPARPTKLLSTNHGEFEAVFDKQAYPVKL